MENLATEVAWFLVRGLGSMNHHGILSVPDSNTVAWQTIDHSVESWRRFHEFKEKRNRERSFKCLDAEIIQPKRHFEEILHARPGAVYKDHETHLHPKANPRWWRKGGGRGMSRRACVLMVDVGRPTHLRMREMVCCRWEVEVLNQNRSHQCSHSRGKRLTKRGPNLASPLFQPLSW